MLCPKCKNEMEYEEIKFPAGEWLCGECGDTYYGEQIATFNDIYHEVIGENTNE